MVCDVLKLLVALTGITCCQNEESRSPRYGRNFKKLKNPRI